MDAAEETTHKKMTAEEQIELVKALGFKPYRDRVLVTKVIDEELTKSGRIVIPQTARDRPQRGVVLAVGEGMILPDGRARGCPARVGDEVLFARYAGTDIMLDGLDVTVLREDEILGGMPPLPAHAQPARWRGRGVLARASDQVASEPSADGSGQAR